MSISMVTIVAVFVIAVAIVGYVSFLGRMKRRVAKAWLHVYETFQARADKVPLLVELVRRDAPEYEGVLKELIVARGETAGMSLPSSAKRDSERALGEALERVMETAVHDEKVLKDTAFLMVRGGLERWDENLPLQILNYHKTLELYRIFALGRRCKGYEEFEN